MDTTARGRLRLSPRPRLTPLSSTAVSTTPLSTAVPTPMAPTPTLMVSTTTARGRLRPSPTMVTKVTAWTTTFDNYKPRPKTITTKNLFQQKLHYKTGRYCQTKTKKHVKVQTATLIVSPSNNILGAEINNRALCLPKK